MPDSSTLEAQPLWTDGPANGPTLTFYPLPAEATCHGHVLVLPGGAYMMHADYEGHDIAECLNRAGFDATVLKYRLASNGHQHPDMIHDAQRAMRVVRRRIATGKARGQKVAVFGFSAGGHLAATLTVHHDTFTSDADELADDHAARPDAAVLCYAVIDFTGDAAHAGSRQALLGERREHDVELRQLLSPQLHVDADTPPTFLWHTAEDDGVLVANSLMFAQACADHGVPVELHVYENGPHGMGLAVDDPSVGTWIDHAVAFLKRHL